MSTWIYQMNQKDWPPEKFRWVIWEQKPWKWGYGTKRGGGVPERGDTLIFFYSPRDGKDPGIYGWGVLDEWDEDAHAIYFTPATPTDHLKMDPWWDKDVEKAMKEIRGKMSRGTLFYVPNNKIRTIRDGVQRWLSAKRDQPH